jgi:hypothetical protein
LGGVGNVIVYGSECVTSVTDPDPDPGILLNSDPDPDQGCLMTQFFFNNSMFVLIKNRQRCPVKPL